jgi:hypothetical protein
LFEMSLNGSSLGVFSFCCCSVTTMTCAFV